MASHMEVAHRWAQQTYGEEVRSIKGFNMFFDGPRIFSHGYHFEIARIVTAPDGRTVVLFNGESRSISTSKHQSYVRRAIPSRIPVFDVFTSPERALASPEAVLRGYEQQAAELYAKAKRARTNGPYLVERADRLLVEAECFAEAFEISYQRPALGDLTELVERQRAAQAEARKERAERERVETERRRVQDAADFADWQNGVRNVCPYSYHYTDNRGAYLRRIGDDLQTSLGAVVPWSHAVKAFRFVKLMRERGDKWQRNGKQVRVGHYQLDNIAANGDFHAGCHFIEWNEVERLAKRENVFDLSPSIEAQTVSV